MTPDKAIPLALASFGITTTYLDAERSHLLTSDLLLSDWMEVN